MITGKIKLRDKQWGISIGAVDDDGVGGKLCVAVIHNGGVTYCAEVGYENPAAPEVALRSAFRRMVDAGDITWSELGDIADELDPYRGDDADIRVCPDTIYTIMTWLTWFG
ncbi:MAG: hypothetical protein [Bacteriophage sp.]|nr:MAG: hypothetical protein [Bacteriophage sp.]